MKIVVIAIAILIAQVSYAAEEYGLEGLMNSKMPDSLPAAISRLVRTEEKNQLDYCQKDKHYTNKAMKGFFGAVVLNLNDDSKNDYLIYPKMYCFNMFGAHSIPYWIALSSSSGYRLVQSGSTDVVKIMDSKTNGSRDIINIYGEEETKYVFSGKKYEMVE